MKLCNTFVFVHVVPDMALTAHKTTGGASFIPDTSHGGPAPHRRSEKNKKITKNFTLESGDALRFAFGFPRGQHHYLILLC